jgi:hypothetical protein
MFTDGVVPAHSRPYYGENENDGDNVEAQVDRPVAQNQDGGKVERLLLPVNCVNKKILPRLHSDKILAC